VVPNGEIEVLRGGDIRRGRQAERRQHHDRGESKNRSAHHFPGEWTSHIDMKDFMRDDASAMLYY
jgi:hypothetical protein